MDQRWPAHLHINLVPEARGTGAAQDLMAAWQERLTHSSSPGCHLQTLVENTRATRFFEKSGFAPHGPTPLVPGVRQGTARASADHGLASAAGWLEPTARHCAANDPDGNQFKLEETMRADALLIGRRTYDSFAGAWPERSGEFADKFNSMPKFVVSTTLKDPEWNNTTVLDSGDATAQVRKLKEEFDGELQVPGSHRLVQELIESDLVDQINLMIFPVILGTGKRAIEDKPEWRKLKLKESRVVGDGVVVSVYERTR
jgi:dihydrofolate reductase